MMRKNMQPFCKMWLGFSKISICRMERGRADGPDGENVTVVGSLPVGSNRWVHPAHAPERLHLQFASWALRKLEYSRTQFCKNCSSEMQILKLYAFGADIENFLQKCFLDYFPISVCRIEDAFEINQFPILMKHILQRTWPNWSWATWTRPLWLARNKSRTIGGVLSQVI